MGRPDGKNLQILDLHRLASLQLSCLLKLKKLPWPYGNPKAGEGF